jgi:hypothetical protein
VAFFYSRVKKKLVYRVTMLPKVCRGSLFWDVDLLNVFCELREARYSGWKNSGSNRDENSRVSGVV